MSEALWHGFMVYGRHTEHPFAVGEYATENDVKQWPQAFELAQNFAGGRPARTLEQLNDGGTHWVRVVNAAEVCAQELDEHPAVLGYHTIVQSP